MTAHRLALASALLMIVLANGCTTHRALRRNTIKQAGTVTDIHQQQVLDNLAKFLYDPHAVPSFALATQGTSDVTDNGQASGVTGWLANGFDKFSLTLGASRTAKQNWTMTPVTDPRKLELMRCAYQRVLANCGVAESACCPDCKKRFNKFYTGRTHGTKYTKDGHVCYACENGELPNLVPQPCDDYCICGECACQTVKTDDAGKAQCVNVTQEEIATPKSDSLGSDSKAVVLDETITCHNGTCPTNCPSPSNGTINSECLYPSCCWFRVGKKDRIPKNCQLVGHYCGTYIWVPCGQGREKFAQLTLAILDYAVHEDRSLPTKEVTAYLNRNGCPTNKDDAELIVKATMSISTPSVSVLKTDIDSRALAERLFGASTLSKSIAMKESNLLEEFRTAARQGLAALQQKRLVADDVNIRNTLSSQIEGLESVDAATLDEISFIVGLEIDEKAVPETLPLNVNRGHVNALDSAMKEIFDPKTKQRLSDLVQDIRKAQQELPRMLKQERRAVTALPDLMPLPQMRTPTPGAGLLLQQQMLETVR